MELNIETPYLVNGKKAVRFVIEPVNYVKFVDIALEAADAKNPKVALNAGLIRNRAKVVDVDGKFNEITPELLHAMPRPVAMPLVKFFDKEGEVSETETPEERAARIEKQAKIITDGDGVSTPILVKLGDPIEGQGKTISELEFIAKTYGDIETVLAGTNELEQTVELIKIAKPPGMLALPSWGIEAISVRDGSFIRHNVLPRFLE